MCWTTRLPNEDASICLNKAIIEATSIKYELSCLRQLELCLVQKKSQCHDYYVTHPGQFEPKEDIVVEEKAIFPQWWVNWWPTKKWSYWN